MINKRELKQEYFDIYIGSMDNAIKILDYANRMANEDGGQEHEKVLYHMKKIIASGKMNLNQARWISTYARKRNILNN